MKIIYHDDPDGWCAAAIAWRALIEEHVYKEDHMIPMQYGRELPWKKIQPDEEVYMLDFSLQPFEEMADLAQRCDLTWIDHHISALEAYEELKVPITGLRKDGEAGCELTWRYFYPNHPMPKAVRWIGRYDVWDHRKCKEAMPFQYGLKVHPESPQPSEHFSGTGRW